MKLDIGYLIQDKKFIKKFNRGIVTYFWKSAKNMLDTTDTKVYKMFFIEHTIILALNLYCTYTGWSGKGV